MKILSFDDSTIGSGVFTGIFNLFAIATFLVLLIREDARFNIISKRLKTFVRHHRIYIWLRGMKRVVTGIVWKYEARSAVAVVVVIRMPIDLFTIDNKFAMFAVTPKSHVSASFPGWAPQWCPKRLMLGRSSRKNNRDTRVLVLVLVLRLLRKRLLQNHMVAWDIRHL